ncbi:Beta-1,4-galactosyltransferase 3 [Cichlidogyrus casuarinus]|uniref:Large ribosomal subunit protein eL34 n=1 Tax=Cichlidogyrus casuarinus TaxID=1844966 RepID=A0ABD2QH15_9PLAT
MNTRFEQSITTYNDGPTTIIWMEQHRSVVFGQDIVFSSWDRVKTPGGKLVYIYQKKLGTLPKCGDCKKPLNGITPSRPCERTRMNKNSKTVSRTYGGARCHKCVRDRIIRAFMMEEEKVIKRIAKKQAK